MADNNEAYHARQRANALENEARRTLHDIAMSDTFGRNMKERALEKIVALDVAALQAERNRYRAALEAIAAKLRPLDVARQVEHYETLCGAIIDVDNIATRALSESAVQATRDSEGDKT